MDISRQFYSSAGPITDLGTDSRQVLIGLPTDVRALCRVASGLVIHEFLAGAYGVNPGTDRSGELEIRMAVDLVAAITTINDQPVRVHRPPEQRLFGNCRQFCVLTTAFLRRAGVPARCRAGFADYFEDGMWTDHWIVELWSESDARWIRTDPQLDDVQLDILGIDFDRDDLPPGRFLSGAEAWQASRTGALDSESFGIQDMRGSWFIGGAAIRDLAALNKVETHTWDTWGAMNQMTGRLDAEQVDLIDSVAETIIHDDLKQIRRLYGNESLTMPGTVISQRARAAVKLPL